MFKYALTFFLFFSFASAFGQLSLDCNSQPTRPILLRVTTGTDVQNLIGETNRALPGNIGLELQKVVSERFGYYLLQYRSEPLIVSILDYLKGQPGVISAEFDQPLMFRDSIPNDNFYPQQWNLEKIELPPVWSVSTGGNTLNGDEIVLAIMDSGFDINQEDLQANLWFNEDEIPGDGIDNDGNGYADDIHGWNFRLNTRVYSVEDHGTWVAGVLGAAGNNGMGVASPSWNVKVMYLEVRNTEHVIEALEYVLDMRERYNATNGAKGAYVVAVNGSFGFDKRFCNEYPAWSPLYDPLGQAGVLNVAPPANEDWNVDQIGDVPTTCTSDYLLTVTSSNILDERPTIGAYGPVSIDVAAPGRDIYTTYKGNEYEENYGGNSLASPLVAGVVGLLYSLPCEDLAQLMKDDPAATALLMKEAILNSVDPLPDFAGKTVTGGRINARKAMEYLHAYCTARPEERNAGNFKELYFGEPNIIRLYPNPVADQLNVEYSVDHFGTLEIAIMNSFGQILQVPQSTETAPFEKQRTSLDVAHLPSGTYYITIVGNEDKATEKFIKL
ncbi:MAG: hypothetical protein Kow0027_01820 [Saprospiraceae bacterium]